MNKNVEKYYFKSSRYWNLTTINNNNLKIQNVSILRCKLKGDNKIKIQDTFLKKCSIHCINIEFIVSSIKSMFLILVFVKYII